MPAGTRQAVTVDLAVACRVFADCGFDEAAAGHLSARDPLDPELFWVNPNGAPLDLMTPGDLVLVDHAGTTVAGSGVASNSAWRLHGAVYRARPDVASAMHAHPVHAKALASLGRELLPINQESCIFAGRHSVFHEFGGPFSDPAEAAKVAGHLEGDQVAVVLRHHGLLTVGASVRAAAYRFFVFERSAQVQLLAEAVAPPPLVGPDVVALFADDAVHSEQSFEPWHRSVTRRHPEVLLTAPPA